MRLLQLDLENWRSHVALDLDLSGIAAAAIVGPNGAGKSSLLLALDWCFTGNSSADELISRGADRGGVTVTLEQSGKRWRVNRGRERNKRSWLVVEEEKSEKFTPLAQRTMAESQKIIDEQILGMDGDAWRASVYAPQGEVGALAALTPGKRKELIGSLLGLGEYEQWREKASVESRTARSAAESARERLGEIEARLSEASMRFEDTESVQKARVLIAGELSDQEKELDAAITREAAVEKVRRRQQLVAQMESVKEGAEEARKREASRAAAREKIAEMEYLPAKLSALEAEKSAHDKRAAQHSAIERELETQRGVLESCKDELDSLAGLVEGVEAKITEAKLPGARCPTCNQEVKGEHQALALAELTEELKRHHAKTSLRVTERDELQARCEELAKRVEAASISEFDENAYIAARDAARELEHAEATLEALQGGTTMEELHERWAALKAEAAELPEGVPPGSSPTEVRERIGTCQERLRLLEEALREDTAARRQAAELENKRESLRADAVAAEIDERAYAVLAKAFSRDGIPALILDNAVGGIEAATNETLEQLGAEMSVRLVTQRQTKSGGLSETLDILVDDGAMERELSSFSGGERGRVHIALRLGLAAVLSAGSGLELGFMAIDELPDVDNAGIELFADLLSRLPLQVLVVSHDPELVAAMPQQIVVERAAGASSAVSVR